MCQRHWCADCDQEMIHRDNRKYWESSSAIGQIISRDGPRSNHFGGCDIDFTWHERRRPDGMLLRLIEHKQPAQKLGYSQEVILRDIAMILDHFMCCPTARMRMDPASGVFMIRGEVGAHSEWPRATFLKGPQTIERVDGGAGTYWRLVTTQSDFFVWLESIPIVMGTAST